MYGDIIEACGASFLGVSPHADPGPVQVNDEASDRVLAVEQEYNKKRRPIYAQRAEIIQKVPLFWQRTLLSHPTLADQLTDDDSQVLEFLVEVRSKC